MHVFSMYSAWSARFKVTVTYLFYCFNEINCIAKLLLPVTFGWLFKPSAGVSDNERIAFSVAFCWHCPRSMWSRVYLTVRCLSVCLPCLPVSPSVCPIHPLQLRAASLLLWVRRKRDIDRLLHDRRRSSTRSQHGAQQQMRVVPRLQLTYSVGRWTQQTCF